MESLKEFPQWELNLMFRNREATLDDLDKAELFAFPGMACYNEYISGDYPAPEWTVRNSTGVL
jgi:hypothetical protein